MQVPIVFSVLIIDEETKKGHLVDYRNGLLIKAWQSPWSPVWPRPEGVAPLMHCFFTWGTRTSLCKLPLVPLLVTTEKSPAPSS